MTIAPRFLPRPGLLHHVPMEVRTFQVAGNSRILTKCHWQPFPQGRPTLLMVHGLEGCTESHYMMGIAHKGWQAGINVVRINQRNCGGTEHLTPTLYNGGLTGDLRAVVMELADRDGLKEIWLAGYSMGGNLMLTLAGQLGAELSIVQGVIAVCPNIHPAACVEALQQQRNWVYHHIFLSGLKARVQRKARMFPGKFDLSKLSKIKTLWEFDDTYTAPDDGYKDAADYYEKSGARHVLGNIRVPCLIITAQDDPVVPYDTFKIDAMDVNPLIKFLAPQYGGHCGFLQEPQPKEDVYWAENRMIEFVLKYSDLLIQAQAGN